MMIIEIIAQCLGITVMCKKKAPFKEILKKPIDREVKSFQSVLVYFIYRSHSDSSFNSDSLRWLRQLP
jgi:hypothetical protein